jgi:outer membrane protein
MIRPLRVALSGLVLSASLLAAPSAFAQSKIAVVDVNRAVSSTEDGLRATATLKKVFDNRQVELNKKQNDLQKQRDDIEKQSKVLSKEALGKRMEDWQKQMLELQQVFVEYNKEIEKKQKEITDPILEKMLAVVKRIATTDGYDVVMEKAMAAYTRADLDITDRCIQMYNQGGAGAAPKAPQAAPKK